MKRSFTSSSRRRVITAIIAFSITLVTIMSVDQGLGTLLARRFYLGKMVMEDLPPAYAFQDEQDWYVAYDGFGLDHYVLYHGLGESIKHALQADVLFVGNSQVAYGFPKSVLKHGKLETGLTFYNLGFGYDEGSTFVMALIEKHDLRPKFVIANATTGRFFKPRGSEFGQKVMEASRWEAWKTVLEWSLTWRVRNSRLNERLPNWRALRPPGRIWVPRFIYCRSISTGSWAAYRERQRPVPVGTLPVDATGKMPKVDNEALSIALKFKRALATRGTNLILTHVPSPDNLAQRSEVIALAAALDVPFVGPVVDGLVTRDGGHLDDESAKRFGDQFIREFKALLKR
ncbi:MAG: hypothetical protein GY774_32780 [Planctomycetes bacterium]|nr:hypothetical protein [Planctomycetota bacterium]